MEKIPNFQKIEQEDKRLTWDNKLKELEKVTDRLGMPIDNNILETVAGLNLLEVSTSSSCGGHVRGEGEDRIRFPYFGGHAPDEPKARFVGEQELRNELATKYGIDPEDIDSDERSLHEYWDTIQSKDYQETQQYKQWMALNESIENRVNGLVEEFYRDIKTSPEIRLHMGHIYPGYIVETGDDSEMESLAKSGLSEEEVANKLEDRVRAAREEMDKFTKFLKTKFFQLKK